MILALGREQLGIMSPAYKSLVLPMTDRSDPTEPNESNDGLARSEPGSTPDLPSRSEPPLWTTIVLLRRHKAGDPDALNDLIARCLPRLRAWAHGKLPRHMRSMSNTEDLIQDALVSSIRHVMDFEPVGPGAFLGYLRKAVRNKVLDEITRYNSRPKPHELPEDLEADEPSALRRAMTKEAFATYECALDQLSPEEQSALVGRFEFGYSFAELADFLDRPSEDAARMATKRALSRLLQLMKDHDGGR